MGILNKLFGGRADDQYNRLEQADAFMSQGSKAVYDHYNMQGVVDLSFDLINFAFPTNKFSDDCYKVACRAHGHHPTQ